MDFLAPLGSLAHISGSFSTRQGYNYREKLRSGQGESPRKRAFSVHPLEVSFFFLFNASIGGLEGAEPEGTPVADPPSDGRCAQRSGYGWARGPVPRDLGPRALSPRTFLFFALREGLRVATGQAAAPTAGWKKLRGRRTGTSGTGAATCASPPS